MDGDAIAQADLGDKTYNALISYAIERRTEQLSLSPRDLHPAK